MEKKLQKLDENVIDKEKKKKMIKVTCVGLPSKEDKEILNYFKVD